MRNDSSNTRPPDSLISVIKYDPGLQRIYEACYRRPISVLEEVDAHHFRKPEDPSVQKKAHSLAVDPEAHRVYAPSRKKTANRRRRWWYMR
jgi:hypothetical protein